jgi:hypothetical protein
MRRPQLWHLGGPCWSLGDYVTGMGAAPGGMKERTSVYRHGMRSPARLKLKPKPTLDVVVTGGSPERVRCGDWGEAVMLAFFYTHPRTGAEVQIRQAERVPRDLSFDLRISGRLELAVPMMSPFSAHSGGG